jgi:hypothetical protein
MWTTPLDLLERRFPGTSALAATTILGATPPCVAVHARVLERLEGYDDGLPLAQRLHDAVPGPDADVTVLVHVEPLLRRLDWLLDELVDHPRRARRLTRRLDAVVGALESCSTPPPRAARRRTPRPTRVGSRRLHRR